MIETLLADRALVRAFGGILVLLIVASVTVRILRGVVESDRAKATVEDAATRIRSWWLMCLVFASSMALGKVFSVVLFGLLSFLALREFVTLTPTIRADHAAVFWAFYLLTPLQYLLVGIGWYGMFTIFLPVYAFLFVPIRTALAGEPVGFLERTAKLQWGLMVAVYCVSHAPALLYLELDGFDGNAKLLLFLVVVVQASDVLQYLWGKTVGRRKIAPTISPNKTWEGFVGGVASATALGAGLWWLTPFSPVQAAAMALLICLLGFAGGLTMSAIKRDRGVKDFGTVLAGHGGILDRIDSLCFAAPVFFHLTRYFFRAVG